MARYFRFLLVTILTLVLTSCGGSSGGKTGSSVLLAVTGDVSVNIANQDSFILGGTCTNNGAKITVTLGVLRTPDCKVQELYLGAAH